MDRFWTMWTAEYIRNLPPWKGPQGKTGLKSGCMVLVQDDQRPRLTWPLGVVTQLIPGKDGVVRTVKVKMASGELVRSVPRVHDLEFGSSAVNNAPRHVPPSDTSSVCTDDVASQRLDL